MYIEKDSLDDIIHHLLLEITSRGAEQENSKGANKEILGVYIKLTNPLNRISASFTKNLIISPLGEFFWYLSGSNSLKFIQHYIKGYGEYSNDGVILNGAYGKRLFGNNGSIKSQIDTVVNILRKKRNSRQAVIQIFDHTDLSIENNKDVPCTTTLQFFIRHNKLIMFVNMRSNDVFVGLPHDVFCFTMIQELISKELCYELGEYHHFISSCHFYTRNAKKINRYLDEGYQTTKTQMPSMPSETNFDLMREILSYEESIRCGCEVDLPSLDIAPYWKDLLIILNAYSMIKNKSGSNEINDLLDHVDNKVYRDYIKEKLCSRPSETF